jgi:4-alpha-glucanotransferase
MTDAWPELIELAAAHGVVTEYRDWHAQHVRVPAETITAVLRAVGVDASTPEATRVALAEHRLARWRRMLPPCLVTRAGWTPRFGVHVHHGDPVEVWVELEDGGLRHDVAQQDHWVDPVVVDGVLTGEATFALPGDLPLGWHRLCARSPERQDSVPLVVTPRRLELPRGIADRHTWGFMVQLYSMRSRRSWGLGDLADLADLAAWSGHELGAGFVLVNPLQAAAPVLPLEPSPYLPGTRRFIDPIHLRIEAVPELAYLPPAERAQIDALAFDARKRNDSDDLLDRDAVWAAKRAALHVLHRTPRSPGREAVYRSFLDEHGQALRDYATWCALAERLGAAWRDWPAELRDPRSPEVAALAAGELAETVDFHCWLQWLADEQLAVAQAQAAGMPLGIIHDLPVGVDPDGADTWTLGDVYAQGVTVGAPPDAFNQQGQDWSQPPWRPDRLAETGYAAYRDMLHTVLRHAGGVRIDHVIGLFRLWWVPEGSPPSAGTYVRCDHEALIGILALEAHRAGALVIGEDLGTVEPWVRKYLADRGVLGTSILWFEKDAQDRPLAPEHWRELALATVTTHDLPPTAAYLAGEHIELRHRLGLLTRPVEQERAVDAAERRAWLELLASRGLLDPDQTGAGSEAEEAGVAALHRLLAATPCRLLGVALPDAVGDRRAQNLPGTCDEYPNWRVPLADAQGRPLLVEDVVVSPRLQALAAVVHQGIGDSASGSDLRAPRG